MGLFGNKEDPKILFNKAMVLFRTGHHKASLGLFNSLLKSDPKNVPALYTKGLALNAIRKYHDAAICFEKVLEIKDDARACNNLGIALSEMGNTDEALEMYNRALSIDSKYASAMYNKGILYDKMLRLDDALDSINSAIKADSKNNRALFYKGLILGKLKRHSEALDSFTRLCKRDRKNQDALFHKGIELGSLNLHQEALDVFDTLLDNYPKSASLLYAKARSLVALNHLDEGYAFTKQALSKDSKRIKKWAVDDDIFTNVDDPRFEKLFY